MLKVAFAKTALWIVCTKGGGLSANFTNFALIMGQINDIFSADSAMGVLMLVSVFYTGWTCWGQGFGTLGIRTKTALLSLDIAISIAVIVLATVTGDGCTQMVWATLAVVSFVRMVYMRDNNKKKDETQ